MREEFELDAVIIGAGAAGLMAARELIRAAKRVVVLEASQRIGGRVMTIHGTGAGIPVELGAEFIHGDAPETMRLLGEARIPTVPVLGAHFRSDNGKLVPQGPIWDRINRVFRLMSRNRKIDRSFADFLATNPGGARLAKERDLARGFVQGFNGADISLISEMSLASEGDPTEGAAEAKRIVSGYDGLIDYLARDVTASIRRGVRATRIVWGESGVRVFDGGGRSFSARTAIMAVPLPSLQDRDIVIEPAVPSLHRAANQLVMGKVVRVSLVVKERFWEKTATDVSFVHTPSRSFNVWWTQHPLQANVITAWSGGPPAEAMSRERSPEEEALSEMGRTFGLRGSRVDSLVESAHAYDWTADPNIRGAYSYSGVGGSNSARTIARSIGDTIFVAGEASESGSSGTVEGALLTGKRAARKVLESLGR